MKKNTVKVTAALTAAGAAAAAGAYWLYGSANAPKHRKMAKSWMLKARAELMEMMEKLEEIDKKKYLAIAESIAKDYGAKAGATREDIAQMVKDFQKTWSHVTATHTGSAKKAPAKKKVAAKKTAAKKRA